MLKCDTNSLVVRWNHIIEQVKDISGGVEQLDSTKKENVILDYFSHFPTRIVWSKIMTPH